MEEWKPIAGDVYEVSNLGRVRRRIAGRGVKAGRYLLPRIDSEGYLTVKLYLQGKKQQIRVHKLVASAFLGACPIDYQVNHVDGDRTNNIATNLEYVTGAQNIAHAIALGLIKQKLSADQVRTIRTLQGTHQAIARQFNVSPSLIGKIKQNQRRKTA